MMAPHAGLERRVLAALEATPPRIPVVIGGCGTGRTTLLLALADDGLKDATTGIRGWNQKADVGIQPLGRGLFYLAVGSGTRGNQTGEITLHRWNGTPAAPFVPATKADLSR